MIDEYIIEPEKKLPVHRFDVLVVGAGTAGCIAATAAARAGAKVLVIEKLPVPSGTLSNGGNGIYSYYGQENDPEKAVQVVNGIPFELYQRCEAAEGCTGMITIANEDRRNPHKPIFNSEVLKGVLCEMLLEAGVHVLLQTMLVGVIMDGSRIKAAIIENKDGRSAVVAKEYIDCSGDGDVAKFAGLEQVSNWENYNQVVGAATSLPFNMGGIDFDRACSEGKGYFALRREVKIEGHDTYRSYILLPERAPEQCKEIIDLHLRRFINIQSLHDSGDGGIGNSKGPHIDASTAEGLTKGEMEARIMNVKFANALRHSVPGFEHAYMSWQAMQLGIRMSKTTICDHMITQEEISRATRFEDEIGLYGYHDLAPTRPKCFCDPPGYYGFPYRMILPVGCDNLFMAGRCVTLELEAHMSTRNTVGCMVMGQGAGVAAALCAEKNCDSRALPYPELRRKLLEQKVILDV